MISLLWTSSLLNEEIFGKETESLEKSRQIISFLTMNRKLEKSGKITLGNFCPGAKSSASKVASVSTYGNNPNLFLFVVTSPSTIFLFVMSTLPLHKIDGSHKSKNNIYSGKTMMRWRVWEGVSFERPLQSESSYIICSTEFTWLCNL